MQVRILCLPLLLVVCSSEIALGQLVIGHRGASRDAPENTLSAFRLAWQRGADGVEGDFRLSSDGRIVCIHDRDTERVAGSKHVVAKTTFAKLRTLDVGVWKDPKWQGETIPSIEEVLATVPPGKKIFLELKVGPKIVEPLERALAASCLRPDQIVIISFNAATIEACEKQMPHLRSHWLTSYDEQEDGSWKPTAREVAQTIERIGADGLGSRALLKVVDPMFIEQYRAAGEDEFHVWTVNKLDAARRYQQMGAWSITTDRPGWLRKQLHQTSNNCINPRQRRSSSHNYRQNPHSGWRGGT